MVKGHIRTHGDGRCAHEPHSGKHYSPFSNHDFGDPRCGVDPRDIDRTQDASARIRRFEAFPPVPGDDRIADSFATHMPPNLLSFDEAKCAGEAMFDRWLNAHQQDHVCPLPPFLREDSAWADLARAAWEAVWVNRMEGKPNEPQT